MSNKKSNITFTFSVEGVKTNSIETFVRISKIDPAYTFEDFEKESSIGEVFPIFSSETQRNVWNESHPFTRESAIENLGENHELLDLTLRKIDKHSK